MKHPIPLLHAVLVLGACNSAPLMRASDFDQSCFQSGECVAVHEGACCPSCPNAAINRVDTARYASAETMSACRNGGPCNPAVACLEREPTCTAGQCALCGAGCVNIHATDYTQACTTSSNCVLIREGSECCPGCPNAAINSGDLGRYNAADQQRGVACQGKGTAGTPACRGVSCAVAEATCTNGTCSVCRAIGCSVVDGGSD